MQGTSVVIKKCPSPHVCYNSFIIQFTMSNSRLPALRHDPEWKPWFQQTSQALPEPPRAEVVGVQFGVCSSEYIARTSAVEIKESSVPKAGTVQMNGINDPRLGTTKRSMLCGRCGCDYKQCVAGHRGHTKLALPVPNGEFIKQVQVILTCVCYVCNRLLLPPDHPSLPVIARIKSPKARRMALYKKCSQRRVCESEALTKQESRIRARMKRTRCTREEAEEFIRNKTDGGQLLERPDLDNLDVTDVMGSVHGCGAVQPSWDTEDGLYVRPVFRLTTAQHQAYLRDPQAFAKNVPQISVRDIVEILENVPREVWPLFGLDGVNARPVDLMWQNFIIPPMTIRPTKIGRKNKYRNMEEDDLTKRLKDIQRTNNELRAALQKHGKPEDWLWSRYAWTKATRPDGKRRKELVFDTWQDAFTPLKLPPSTSKQLQDHYNGKGVLALYLKLYRCIVGYQDKTLTGNSVSQYAQEPSSISCRLRGGQKSNRIRKDCLGARMDFTGRTVIGPNNKNHIRDVTLPHMFVTKMTFPERVTMFNVHRLTSACRRGTKAYPGARFLLREVPRDVMINLDTHDRFQLELKVGEIVERHLGSQDMCLANRQPSLHKYSILGHRIRVNPDPTVLSMMMHLAVTTPYNADYDGDEMNSMIVQTILAQVEAKWLMLVDMNLMKDGRPLVGMVQNVVIEAYILTDDETRVPYRIAESMLNQHQQWRKYRWTELPDREEVTGHEIFSCILPQTMWLRKAGVVIEQGQLQPGGQLTKKAFNGHRGIIHQLILDHGGPFASNWITGTYDMLEFFGEMYNGFTVAVDDCWVPRHVLRTAELRDRVNQWFGQHVPHDHDINGGSIASQITESNVCRVLDVMRDVQSRRAQAYLDATHKDRRNGFADMTRSGAKGNETNQTQVSAMMGNQFNHKSKRFHRVTPHFVGPEDDQAVGHGMVHSCFAHGTMPVETFHHIAAARAGLVSVAVKTRQVGTLQRRLGKALEDLVSDIHQRVVNSVGDVIQICYGSDGFDPNALEQVSIPCLEGRPNTEDRVHTLSATLMDVLSTNQDRERLAVVFAPFDTNRLVLQIGKQEPRATQRFCDMATIRRWRKSLWDQLLTYGVRDTLKLELYVWDTLSPQRLHGWATEARLRRLFTEIVSRCVRAMVPAGEMVGQSASQNISEPVTQKTLKQFHYTGSESSLASGVPRLEEIIDAKPHTSTPSQHIYFDPPLSADEAKVWCDQIIERRLEQLVHHMEWNPTHEDICLRTPDLPDTIHTFECLEEHDEFEEDTPCHLLWLVLDRTSAVNSLTGDMVERCTTQTRWPQHGLRWAFGPNWIALRFWPGHPEVSVWANKCSVRGNEMGMIFGLVEQMLLRCRVVGVSGIHDFAVSSVSSPHLDSVTGQVTWKPEVVVLTRGSNLHRVLQLDGVDITRTRTNDIHEMARVFGIVTGQWSIEHETADVIAASGASVAARHVKLMALRMTSRGVIVANRGVGIRQRGTSVIRNASLEKCLTTFKMAALHGSYDPCKGMTECILVNRKLQGGTGIVRVDRVPYEPSPEVQEHNWRVFYRRKSHIPPAPDAWLDMLRTPTAKPILAQHNMTTRPHAWSVMRHTQQEYPYDWNMLAPLPVNDEEPLPPSDENDVSTHVVVATDEETPQPSTTPSAWNFTFVQSERSVFQYFHIRPEPTQVVDCGWNFAMSATSEFVYFYDE